MLLIPSMELRSGHSVYTQHSEEADTLITEDPMEAIERWVDAGAKRIHIFDVDAVQAGQPVNSHKIAEVHRRYPQLEIQVAGIRKEEDILIWLDAGAKYLIMNSRAICRRRNFIAEMCMQYQGSIMVALDAHEGQVRFQGHETNHDLVTLAKEFGDEGVQGILLTEIPDFGHVNSYNILTSCELAAKVDIPVIANGGVSCIADLQALENANEQRLAGIVIGRPLHDQQLDFKDAQECVLDL
jgi:phosphoribosylformimino-5-aminoimidazole carboxamide ribotide isomerase